MPLSLIKKENTCCFTGHRMQKLPWGSREDDPRCTALKIQLYDTAEQLYHNGIRNFICGMAQGSDILFCEEILKLREDYPLVTIEAALPCRTQADRWPEVCRNRYYTLLNSCDYVTYLSECYTESCMKQRNIYMVDKSCVLIAVYNGRFGGTMQTVNYAKQQGIQVITIQP